MNKYRNKILSLWKENKKKPIFKYSPLLIPKSIKINKTLIVGFNPSKSYKSLEIVRNHFISQWEKDNLIKNINNQKSYNNFLKLEHLKKHQNSIWKIQEWCHLKHKHFIKQNGFLNHLEIKRFTFIDLFPIWECKQSNLVDYLKKNSETGKKITSYFIDLLEEQKIEKLIFLNKGSFKKFRSHIKNLILNYEIKHIDVNKRNSKIIEKGSFKLNNRNIKYYCVGIGGWGNNLQLTNKLYESNFFT